MGHESAEFSSMSSSVQPMTSLDLESRPEFTHEYAYGERGMLEQAFSIGSDGIRHHLPVGQKLRAAG